MSSREHTGVQTDTDRVVVVREEGRGGREGLQVEEQLRLRYLAASSLHLGEVSQTKLLVKTMILRVELGPGRHAVKQRRRNTTLPGLPPAGDLAQ